MPRSLAELPKGARITDYISLGVLAEKFPVQKVQEILKETGRESQRQRHLPAHVVVYYVIALALYMEASYGEVLRCLLEGLEWLGGDVRRIRRTAKSAISQARKRLGAEPLKRLYQEVVGPIATLKPLGRELSSYLVEGSYPEESSGLAAAHFESRQWTDFVRIEAKTR